MGDTVRGAWDHVHARRRELTRVGVDWHLDDPTVDPHDYTCGRFATETEAQAWLVAKLSGTGMFTVLEQVPGQMVQPAFGQDVRAGVRLDVMLAPTQHAVDAGWAHGYIGIEVKRSQEKVGKPLAQMCDYARSAFDIGYGRLVVPSLVLLFPWVGPSGGPLASVIAQQRLGSIKPYLSGSLTFTSNLDFMKVQDRHVSLLNIDRVARQGRKAGSR